MYISSSLPLSSNPLFFNITQIISTDSPNNNVYPLPLLIPKNPFHSISKSHICFAFSSSDKSNYEREEARWLREEQRWLREEQRWLREELRWKAERESLLSEIEALKHKIEEAGQGKNQNLNVQGLLQVLKKEVNQIAERGSSAAPLVVETVAGKVVEVVKEVVKVLEKETEKVDKVKNKRATLRKGSEGDEVRVMQEALQKLGFYCGDEDTEYSMFSSGTERAIKTWQATLRVPEDGIMTAELLEKLYMDQKSPGSTVKADIERNDTAILQKEVLNGAAVTSVTEISEIQQRVVKGEGVAEVDVTRNRVFLLGENRWEDPSRLVGRNKQVGGGTNTDATTKCISCRGEGRLLCTECDGTGEPNIEEQFMEWVDEGAKCPYCEGLGYSLCDVCGGKKVS